MKPVRPGNNGTRYGQASCRYETFVRVTGYSREETSGKLRLSGLWQPDDRAASSDLIRRFGELNDAEYVFRTRSGRRNNRLRSAEKVEIGGASCALRGIIQDITRTKLAAERLRESEERFGSRPRRSRPLSMTGIP